MLRVCFQENTVKRNLCISVRQYVYFQVHAHVHALWATDLDRTERYSASSAVKLPCYMPAAPAYAAAHVHHLQGHKLRTYYSVFHSQDGSRQQVAGAAHTSRAPLTPAQASTSSTMSTCASWLLFALPPAG